jgi:hypothetical protein
VYIGATFSVQSYKVACYEYVSRKVAAKMLRFICCMYLCVGVVAFEFDCTELDSKFYLEKKLQR